MRAIVFVSFILLFGCTGSRGVVEKSYIYAIDSTSNAVEYVDEPLVLHKVCDTVIIEQTMRFVHGSYKTSFKVVGR